MSYECFIFSILNFKCKCFKSKYQSLCKVLGKGWRDSLRIHLQSSVCFSTPWYASAHTIPTSQQGHHVLTVKGNRNCPIFILNLSLSGNSLLPETLLLWLAWLLIFQHTNLSSSLPKKAFSVFVPALLLLLTSEIQVFFAFLSIVILLRTKYH